LTTKRTLLVPATAVLPRSSARIIAFPKRKTQSSRWQKLDAQNKAVAGSDLNRLPPRKRKPPVLLVRCAARHLTSGNVTSKSRGHANCVRIVGPTFSPTLVARRCRHCVAFGGDSALAHEIAHVGLARLGNRGGRACAARWPRWLAGASLFRPSQPIVPA